MSETKEHIKALHRQIKDIDERADNEKSRLETAIYSLQRNCKHNYSEGDSYDVWCSKCGKKQI